MLPIKPLSPSDDQLSKGRAWPKTAVHRAALRHHRDDLVASEQLAVLSAVIDSHQPVAIQRLHSARKGGHRRSIPSLVGIHRARPISKLLELAQIISKLSSHCTRRAFSPCDHIHQHRMTIQRTPIGW